MSYTYIHSFTYMHIYMHVKYKRIIIKSSWPVAQEEQAVFDGIWGSTG